MKIILQGTADASWVCQMYVRILCQFEYEFLILSVASCLSCEFPVWVVWLMLGQFLGSLIRSPGSPQEEKGVWGSQGGEKGLEFSRRKKRQMSPPTTTPPPHTFLSLTHIKCFFCLKPLKLQMVVQAPMSATASSNYYLGPLNQRSSISGLGEYVASTI